MSNQPSPERNVLVAIDVENDFITGSLAVKDGASVIPPLNKVSRAIRQSDGTVIYTRDWHPPETPHFNKWPVHCVAGTEGAEFHPELDVQPDDIVISKGQGQDDGYSGTEGHSDNNETLESLITPKQKQERVNVFIGGLATDYCVQATTVDLGRLFSNNKRVKLYVIRDAIRAVNLQVGDEQRALEAMQEAGAIALSSKEILARFLNQ